MLTSINTMYMCSKEQAHALFFCLNKACNLEKNIPCSLEKNIYRATESSRRNTGQAVPVSLRVRTCRMKISTNCTQKKNNRCVVPWNIFPSRTHIHDKNFLPSKSFSTVLLGQWCMNCAFVCALCL